MTRWCLLVVLSLLLGGDAHAAGGYAAVTVKADAPGARVKLGKRSWPAPKVLWLKQGKTYTVVVSAPGRQDRELVLAPTRRRGEVEVKLDLVSVRLEVSASSPEMAGGALRVDGELRGAVPATLDLHPGRHQVRVEKEGWAPWSTWVELEAGKRQALVVALTPALGRLMVSASPAGASVLVDGREQGAAPLTLEGVSPGSHVVELRAEGHASRTEVFTVKAGETATVNIALKPVQAKPRGGALQVLTEPQPVDLYLDGTFRGKTPLKLEDLAEGSHFLSARWPGRKDAEREVAVTAGQITTVKLALEDLQQEQPAEVAGGGGGGNLLVVSSVRGASVYLDGVLVGQTPYAEPGVEAGPHQVKVSYPGYADLLETIRVRDGKTVRVTAMLQPEGEKAAAALPAALEPDRARPASPASRPRAKLPPSAPPPPDELLSYNGALLLPPGRFMLDLRAGFPFLAALGFRAGLLNTRHLAVDAGVLARTFGEVTEAGVMARLRVMRYDPVALSLDLSLQGGGGPAGRETFTADVGLTTSVSLLGRATLSLRLGGNFFNDRLCPSPRQAGEVDACVFPPRGMSSAEVRHRQEDARFVMSLGADVRILGWLSVHGGIEGAPGMPRRRIFSAPFVSFMPGEDPLLYGWGGATARF